MKKINISDNFKLAIDLVLCFLILLQSIKKGGFYSYDIIFFVSSIGIIGAIYGLFIVSKYCIDRLKKKRERFKVSDIKSTVILFALLAISYVLPILFNTAASGVDAKFEFFRYASIFFVYLIIKNSNNKKIYYFTLIALGLLQAFIGIDGLASRVLAPYLKYINSGYLSKDLTRLSGTIQYANTAAILIAISGILLLDKINSYINKIREKITKMNKFYLTICFVLFTVANLSVILTGSRLALSIYMLTLIVYLLKSKTNKFNLLSILVISYVISFLSSNNILDLVLTNSSKIYFVFLTYIILSVLAIRYIIKYIINNDVIKNRAAKINKRKTIISVTAIALVYILIGLNIYKPLNMVYNEKENTITRQVYGVKHNELNNINIKVKENELDSKYSIVVYEENDKFEQELVARFEYFENESNNFKLNFTPKDNTKRLNLVLISYKGNVSILEFKLNERVKPLEYSMLPSDMVFRFRDSLYGSTSLRDRLNYVKDSYKIWLTSPVVGTGGEGFKFLYKNVQTLQYTSTEAHNSILQIFVESGIVGGITVCLIIYLVISKNKFSVLKLTFVMYILHSLTDLNFSYFICLIVFSMLIALIEDKTNKKEII